MLKNKFNVSVFQGNETYTRLYQEKYAKLFSAGMTILDVGCGEGIFLDILREADINGIGIDISERATNVCRTKNLRAHLDEPLHFLQSNDRQFDGIFCSHFIEHLQPETLINFLEKVYEVLLPDGFLILITPNIKNIEVLTETFWLDISHVRPYPISLLQKMLEHVGFRIISSGIDSDTCKKIPRKNLMLAIKYILNKTRFGKYYGQGDSFIIAKKTLVEHSR